MGMDLPEARNFLRQVPPPMGLMKISEAAAIAGVCAETLRRRVRRGELAAWGNPRRVAREAAIAGAGRVPRPAHYSWFSPVPWEVARFLTVASPLAAAIRVRRYCS